MASREIIHEEKETMFEEPEIVRNMLKSVGETYDHVKEAVTITNPETGNPEKYDYMDYAAERARKNISGAMGSMTEAIKDELTYPTGIVPEARASRGGEKLVDEVEEDPSGPGAMPTVLTSG